MATLHLQHFDSLHSSRKVRANPIWVQLPHETAEGMLRLSLLPHHKSWIQM